ncbi:MAG: hypothetical protein K6G23_02045 [Lachnospiraceae bacterium]|nr:hypothetical protein [Lachnospiraceae bacterium]
MTQLLLTKEYLKNFIGKYEIYLKPLGKFLLALFALSMINSRTGYMSRLDNGSIVLVAALFCSFMPTNFIVVISMVFVVAHFYALSLEAAIVIGMLFMVMALLYFRFAPKDTLVVLLMPMLFVLKIPYVLPICVGLYGIPSSAVAIACGVVAYYAMHYVVANEADLSAMDAEELSARFRHVVDGVLNNRTMLVVMVTFMITVVLVYTIRRLSINRSWTIAIVAGTVVQMLVLLMGDLMLDTDVSVPGILIGSILAVLIAKVMEFLFFNVDYSRTEHVQFEDDEYYYYVKAVPKITVAKPEKTVKKINSASQQRRRREHPAGNFNEV